MADDKNRRFETKAIMAGRVPEDGTNGVTTPIYPSTTYRVSEPGDDSGYVYSRWSNPTRAALERGLAALENGTHALAFSSGLSAINAILHLLKAGDHIVAVDDLYGGTHRQYEQVMKQFGLEFSYVDGRDANNFDRARKENTRLFWIETPTNPLLKLTDIEKVSAIAKAHGILTAVDNTFATPYIQQPLDLGADLVMHSMSKYLGGHCDVIGGCVVTRNKELGEKIYFNQYAVGTMLGPFESWLVLRGIKTLAVRMERHSINAQQIADFLESHSKVKKVYYPGQDSQPVPNNMKLPGGMLSFELDADLDAVKKFCTSLEVFALAESLGGVESLINHPALMTHASIPKEIREANGIGDNLIRLSVGLEHIDDLLIDLRTALDAV
jgi:cystathionine gamma-lyase